MKKILIAAGVGVLAVAVALLGIGTAFAGKQTMQKQVDVEQKPETVFATLTDLNRLSEMGVGVSDVKLPEGEKPAVGYKFELETDYGPAQAEITRFEEGRALACDVWFKGARAGNLEFELTAEGAGTAVAVKVNLDNKPPLGGLYNMAAKRAVDSLLEANQEKIRDALGAAK